jgi:phosphate-selective porin OprO/OprP
MSTKSIGVLAARAGFIGLLLSGVSSVALAQTPDATPSASADPREARIGLLEAELQQLSDEVQDLKRNQATQIQTIAADEKRLPATTSAIASIANGKPTIASQDGRFTATLHAVMQFDAADYFQASPGPLDTDFRRSGAALGTPNIDAAHARNLKNGDVFRRARIGIDGTAFGDWDYRFLFDFAGSGVENAGQVYETWVQYSGFKPFHMRVGAFSPSFGLDDQSSTNGMPFMERAASSDIARGLAAGDTRTAVQLWASGDRWLASGAVTGKSVGVINTGAASVTAQTFGDQLGFVGRVAGTPFKGSDWLVHVGVHGSYVVHPSDASGPGANGVTPLSSSVIGLSNTQELRVDGTKLINTGAIPAKHADTVGVEFAAQKQNVLLQGEYEHFDIARSDGQASPKFSGYYVSGSWVLTGEARKYNTQTAAFDAPAVAHPFSLTNGGLGAWELAVRYSDMDLNFHEGKAGSAVPTSANSVIRGGEEQNITAGLNWYLNPVVRFMLDYSHVKVDRLSPGATANNALALTSAGWQLPVGHFGQQIGQTYDVISIRSQVAF